MPDGAKQVLGNQFEAASGLEVFRGGVGGGGTFRGGLRRQEVGVEETAFKVEEVDCIVRIEGRRYYCCLILTCLQPELCPQHRHRILPQLAHKPTVLLVAVGVEPH